MGTGASRSVRHVPWAVAARAGTVVAMATVAVTVETAVVRARSYPSLNRSLGTPAKTGVRLLAISAARTMVSGVCQPRAAARLLPQRAFAHAARGLLGVQIMDTVV